MTEQGRKDLEEYIVEGLYGEWVLYGDPPKHSITFLKKTNSQQYGKVMFKNLPEDKIYQIIEYEVLVDDLRNVYIDLIIETSGQRIQHKQNIDFMNSWIGQLVMNDVDGKVLHYDRLIPRELEM